MSVFVTRFNYSASQDMDLENEPQREIKLSRFNTSYYLMVYGMWVLMTTVIDGPCSVLVGWVESAIVWWWCRDPFDS